MFRGLSGEFLIDKVLLKLATVDQRQLKTIRLTLAHDFDDDLAAVLGKAGRSAMKCLDDGDFEQVTLPIDAIKAVGVLTDGARTSRVEVPAMLGLKAVGKAGKSEADAPSVLLTFEFVFEPGVWAFLGAFCGTAVWVDLTAKQTDLGLDEPDDGVEAAVRRFKRSVPKDTTVTVRSPGGKSVELVP